MWGAGEVDAGVLLAYIIAALSGFCWPGFETSGLSHDKKRLAWLGAQRANADALTNCGFALVTSHDVGNVTVTLIEVPIASKIEFDMILRVAGIPPVVCLVSSRIPSFAVNRGYFPMILGDSFRLS